MPVFLDTKDADFETAFQRLLSAKREDSPDVDDAVAAIIADVRARGDAAVLELTKRFDRFDLTAATYVRDWALPQFYFHIVAAYAVMRHLGVPLGKADYAGYMMQHLRPGTAPTA